MSRVLIDKNNRLVIRRKNEKLIPQGYFSVDSYSRLIYWLNEPPAWRKRYRLPDKIIFDGAWKINSNHDLILELEQKEQSFKKERLALKGKIISFEKDQIVFEIQSIKNDGLESFQLLKLSGIWQADEYNRVSFLVTKRAFPDTLTFKGSWELNENQQLTYTYEKANLKTKTRYSQALTFSGYWQISSARRLSYILSTATNSRFDFKVQLESPNLRPKEGSIKYRLGAGIRQPGGEKGRIITLYGAWKFSRKAGFIFEMDYRGGRVYRQEFGAEVDFDKNNQIVFKLTAKDWQPLGISLTFTHRLLKEFDSELFLRLKRHKEESGIDVGVRIPW